MRTLKKQEREQKQVIYQHIGQAGESLGNRKPDNPITKETKDSTNKKQSPGGKLVAGNTRKQANVLASIIGHSEYSHLLLVEAQHGFEGRGVEWEVVGIASSYLDPNCSSKTHPRWPAPSFQNQLRHSSYQSLVS